MLDVVTVEEAHSLPQAVVPEPVQARGASPYLAAATAIADELVASAVPHRAGVTWNGEDLVGNIVAEARVVHGPVGPDLYGGAAGIAWFLAHLGGATQSRRIADVARGGLAFALSDANAQLDAAAWPALYGGATGVALAAVEAGEALADESLLASGHRLATRIAQLVRRDAMEAPEIDLIAGVAGTLVGLLSICRRRADEQVLGACAEAAKRLARDRVYEWWGAHEGQGHPPVLCGLGHGASGVAWALAEASFAKGLRRLPATCRAALAYERAWFSHERCAWPDLREPRPEDVAAARWPAWTNAWCHGALGIGAVRWRIYEATGSLTALAEASAAVHAARMMASTAGLQLANGAYTDVTLCHGLGGAAELLLLAHDVSGVPDHHRAARRVGELCLAVRAANAGHWTLGLRGTTNVPGLYTGLAGIGVTMMRLQDPSLVASPMLPGRPRRGGATPGSRRPL